MATRDLFLLTTLLRTFLNWAATDFVVLPHPSPPAYAYFVAMIAFAYPWMAARMRAFKASPVWLVAAAKAIFLGLLISAMTGVRPFNDGVLSGNNGEEFFALFLMLTVISTLPIIFPVILTVGLELSKTAPDAKPSRRPAITSLAYLVWLAGFLFEGPVLVDSATNLIFAQNWCIHIWTDPLSPLRIGISPAPS